MSVIDKEKLDYWESAKNGDLIQLKDEQTISFLMDEDHENLTHGADFTIKRKRKITAYDSDTKWLILNMEFADFQWYLIVKSSGTDFDLYIYYVPDEFEDGDRQDIIDKSDWLFEVWDDGVELKNLSFSAEIQQGEGVIFKTDGPQYGTLVEDDKKEFATVVEYSTDADEENPLMLAIELNQIEEWTEKDEEVVDEDEFGEDIEVTEERGVNINEDSSYIILLQGCKVALNDVDLLKL